MNRAIHRFALSCLAALAAAAVSAPARADFASCAATLRDDGAHAGVSRETLDRAFNGLQPDMKVLEFEKSQPEFKTPIWDYVDGLVDEERVVGRQGGDGAGGACAGARRGDLWRQPIYAGCDLGGRIELRQRDGRRARWCSRSPTLACFGERPAYFRSELMAALKIIDRGDIPADKLAGSWAGAFGQTQFMPSSYLRLAAPGSDGGRDIVDSADDALASTAHYFVKSGWRSGVPWGFEVKLPAGYSGPSGRKAKAADVVLGGARDHARSTGGHSARAKRAFSCPRVRTVPPFS